MNSTVSSPALPSSADPDRVRRMYELYKGGATLAETGAAFGVTRERVRQLFSVHRLPTRSVRQAGRIRRAREIAYLTDDLDEILDAYRSGTSTSALAERWNVGETSVKALIAKWATDADVRGHSANAGQRPVAPGRVSIEPCVRAIRAFADELGRVPTFVEYADRSRSEPTWPSGYCITTGWGWSVALAAAGFSPRQRHKAQPRPSRISEEQCWEALLSVSERLGGRIPSHSDYVRMRNNEDASLPTVRVIRMRLGRWADVVAAWPAATEPRRSPASREATADR